MRVPEDLWRLKVVDPACGSGAFLFQAYNVLEQRYHEVIGHLEEAGEDDAEELTEQVPRFILNDNLYGVDLSPEAVEITQLALWIRSATPGQTLATLSRNISCMEIRWCTIRRCIRTGSIGGSSFRRCSGEKRGRGRGSDPIFPKLKMGTDPGRGSIA